MSVEIFLIVLFAAFLHALWNAIVKGAGDRAAVLGLVALGHVGPGLVLAAHYGPPAAAAYPYIVATTVIHWGYYYLLNIAYRTGDLSVVYPIARGLAPILIAIGGLIWADERLPLASWAGIVAVSAGILLLTRQAASSAVARAGVVAAVGVAVVIAGYSIVDGVGIRVSDNPGGLYRLDIRSRDFRRPVRLRCALAKGAKHAARSDRLGGPRRSGLCGGLWSRSSRENKRATWRGVRRS